MSGKPTREELIYMAKVCEQTERFEDMLEYMKQVLKIDDSELSVEERNLLSVAYKNCVGTKRTSWRILDTLEKKEKAKGEGDQKNLNLVVDFKKKVEKELDKICKEIISTLDDTLIPNSEEASSKVFYLKMKGDYFRYIAEYNMNSDSKDESIPQ
jgi:14-3-3 protein epsilon